VKIITNFPSALNDPHTAWDADQAPMGLDPPAEESGLKNLKAASPNLLHQ
jgi:hypothetical protein